MAVAIVAEVVEVTSKSNSTSCSLNLFWFMLRCCVGASGAVSVGVRMIREDVKSDEFDSSRWNWVTEAAKNRTKIKIQPGSAVQTKAGLTTY